MPSPSPDSRFLALRFAAQDATDFGMGDDAVRRFIELRDAGAGEAAIAEELRIPADVAVERDLLTGHKVKALMYNSQVTSPLTEQIRELAVSSNVPVVPVAETIPPAFKTFQDWQLAQLDDLEKALAK